jgi:hypothetical protein
MHKKLAEKILKLGSLKIQVSNKCSFVFELALNPLNPKFEKPSISTFNELQTIHNPLQ